MKKNQKTALKGHVLYLFILLAIVLLYLVLVFPQMNTQLSALEAQYNVLNAQNTMLSGYESQLDTLAQQTREAEDAYDADTRLLAPAALTNRISDAADRAGVILDSVTVDSNGDTQLAGGYTGALHTAAISISIPDGVEPAAFLRALEGNEGAGFYVQQATYYPTGSGNSAGGASGQQMNVTVGYYTLSK